MAISAQLFIIYDGAVMGGCSSPLEQTNIPQIEIAHRDNTSETKWSPGQMKHISAIHTMGGIAEIYTSGDQTRNSD